MQWFMNTTQFIHYQTTLALERHWQDIQQHPWIHEYALEWRLASDGYRTTEDSVLAYLALLAHRCFRPPFPPFPTTPTAQHSLRLADLLAQRGQTVDFIPIGNLGSGNVISVVVMQGR